MKLTFLFILVLVPVSLFAQDTRSAQLAEMKKLDFLIGEWKGEGWTEYVPGQRRTSPINENVQSRLGGMLLMVEGLGKAKVPGKEEEVITHNALAIITFDSQAKIYRITSYLADGRSTNAEADFVDGRFQWRFKAPQGASIRYTVKLTEKGEWFEIGEMSQNGKDWRQFHEMTLQRVK